VHWKRIGAFAAQGGGTETNAHLQGLTRMFTDALQHKTTNLRTVPSRIVSGVCFICASIGLHENGLLGMTTNVWQSLFGLASVAGGCDDG
jgi:hypothetical protein